MHVGTEMIYLGMWHVPVPDTIVTRAPSGAFLIGCILTIILPGFSDDQVEALLWSFLVLPDPPSSFFFPILYLFSSTDPTYCSLLSPGKSAVWRGIMIMIYARTEFIYAVLLIASFFIEGSQATLRVRASTGKLGAPIFFPPPCPVSSDHDLKSSVTLFNHLFKRYINHNHAYLPFYALTHQLCTGHIFVGLHWT
jgi:hypothetical protein